MVGGWRLAVGGWWLAMRMGADYQPLRRQPLTTPFDPGDSQAGMSFVSDVESDQQGRDRLDRARIGERAAVNIAAAGDRRDERTEALFGLLVIAADNDVAFHFAVETGERLGPDVLEGRDDLNAFGSKLTALLRRRPRPHAQDAGRFASHGRLKRNSDVND